MAKVYLKFNGAVIKEVRLEKNETTFGRKPDNDIEIGHPTISGHHGKIRKDGYKFVLEDLNSTNGTFVNGQRVKSANLKNRDRIGAAGHILEFVLDDAAEASAEPVPAPKVEPKADGKDKAGAEPELIGAKVGPGLIRIISGAADVHTEVPLKELVTYLGTADQAAIKIKGFMAPALAAAIRRKPEGYFLKAIKAGYPKVNGLAIQDQVLLENGATIEAGGTNMVFYATDRKKAS